jgi:transcriptional regulator with XRE-family HTH domain
MVNRIFAFIESLQLTPTEFADKIGVSRASISSIKTGRTQPTLSLVEKIKQRFPEIDINWLILGEGDAPIVNRGESEIELFSDDEVKTEIEVTQNSSNDDTANEYQAVYIAETPRKTEEEPRVINRETDVLVQSTSEIKRSVKKVILLYDDGSFEEFNK